MRGGIPPPRGGVKLYFGPSTASGNPMFAVHAFEIAILSVSHGIHATVSSSIESRCFRCGRERSFRPARLWLRLWGRPVFPLGLTLRCDSCQTPFHDRREARKASSSYLRSPLPGGRSALRSDKALIALAFGSSVVLGGGFGWCFGAKSAFHYSQCGGYTSGFLGTWKEFLVVILWMLVILVLGSILGQGNAFRTIGPLALAYVITFFLRRSRWLGR
jgi:hypothetical protein